MNRIAVTGANGYLGAKICKKIEENGDVAVPLSSSARTSQNRFQLGKEFSSRILDGVDFLIHAAHDFSVQGLECVSVNYEGSLPLLDACRIKDIPVHLVSSTSAFQGVDTGYGKSKLLLESRVLEQGGRVFRAGLIFGTPAGGIVSQIFRQIRTLPVVPIVGPKAPFYITDENTLLQELVYFSGKDSSGSVILSACREPKTLEEIVSDIMTNLGVRKPTIHIWPGLIYGLSKMMETIRVPFPFRTESVRYLLHPMPSTELELLEESSFHYANLDEILNV